MNIEALGELADKAMPTWLEALIGLVILAAVLTGLWAYGQQQFGLGEKAESARWLARENAELVAANAEIEKLNREKAALEAASEQRLADKTAAYLKEQAHEKTKSDAVIADLRTGNAGLFYALASGQGAGAGGVCQAGTAASRGDGGTEAQLPGEIAAALYAEADRADSITRQLGLAQQVILEDRRLCGK